MTNAPRSERMRLESEYYTLSAVVFHNRIRAQIARMSTAQLKRGARALRGHISRNMKGKTK